MPFQTQKEALLIHIPNQTALKIILGIGIVGVLFSGYLSYKELFGTYPLFCTPSAHRETFSAIRHAFTVS